MAPNPISTLPAPIHNFVGNEWLPTDSGETAPVVNPATGEVIATVPLSGARDLHHAVSTAATAFQEWRRVPAGDRIQYLFRLKQLLEEHYEELARIITIECGKTLTESRGELRRAIENVETACGIPILMQGYNAENIASGIDETMIRQPLGVTAVITPFNFPAMIPFWFFPYAIACGNTCVIKPSERVPLTMARICELLLETGLPQGVVNVVNGSKAVVDAMLQHPLVQSVSFVGSSAVARDIYARAAATGKRVQCQGGAKNPVVILPDCDFDLSTRIIADSAFGCAGQRCLAASLAITVGLAHERFLDSIAAAANSRVVGSGLDADVEMGPVITPESKLRIEQFVDRSVQAGSRLVAGGHGHRTTSNDRGNFVPPTVLAEIPAGSDILRTEVFGPVLTVLQAANLGEAITMVNSGEYGNMACLFTGSGAAAREFRATAEAGNIGINIGVAAPIAQFPFSGWKGSFFGDLHGQGRDAVQFFTQQKVVVERWPREWSRTF